MDLKKLKASVADAQAEAKKLVADKVDGQSYFAASIRSNLDHAAELIALHEKFVASNPVEKPAPAN